MSQPTDPVRRSQTTALSKQLCFLLTNKKDDEIFKKFILTLALHLKTEEISTSCCTAIFEKSKKQLSLIHSDADNAINEFETLFRKLSKVDSSDKQAVLAFLLKLSELIEAEQEASHSDSSLDFRNKVHTTQKRLMKDLPHNWLSRNSPAINYPSTAPLSFSSSNVQPIASSTVIAGKQSSQEPWKVSNIKNTTSSRNILLPDRTKKKTPISLDLNAGVRSVCLVNNLPVNHSVSYKTDVPEAVIIKELIFCFQGIEGQVIKHDPSSEGYIIDPKAKVTNVVAVLRLMELGYLHNVIKKFVESSQGKSSIQRGLVMSLREELMEFYKLVSRLHSEVTQDEEILVADTPMSEENLRVARTPHLESLTLRRLLLRTDAAFLRLMILVDLIEELKKCHGGKIISVIHRFSHYGYPELTPVFSRLLHTTTHSLLVLMSHWIVDGTLFDPFDEFFVAHNKLSQGVSSWDSQFILREEMIPDFISKEEAAYVLQAGRCIYFLNEICNEKTEVSKARRSFQQLENSGGDLLPMMEPFNSITELIERAHEESSKLVLDILCQKFNLYEHLHGLRKYMLLGQGDFIRYLMEMIEHKLDGSAHILYQHNLQSILETAIRSTNAQFDNIVILNSLIVKIMTPNDGDFGWDVFRLEYELNGPLATIFKKNEVEYSQLFNFLWNIKRLEYVLSKLWRNQSLINKSSILLTELKSVFVLSCSLISEMVHFIHQLQYYFLTEVLETQWHEFEQVVNKAGSLEEVVEAHDLFLRKIKSGLLQDRNSGSFNLHMSLVKDQILEVKTVQSRFIELVSDETERRLERQRIVAEVGTSIEEEMHNDKCLCEFVDKLKSIKAQFSIISKSYQEFLRKLLLDLSKHPLIEVQMLSSRIDFNEFYKKNDSQLSESIKLSSRKERFQTFDEL
ncbi:unnamed protein product [Bemisia tabaci]|uniref:Gamma-tubulin complex component n=1 Tax=Bemisia tabaci TaxID=7038 RepID=A0A9P0A816_BEMTA|nr:PREDICTED: gamma-tubulin complex component 3 [Bemisia tabaci]CAH0386178.1 unnamed protein product [Bemisia tabaci]